MRVRNFLQLASHSVHLPTRTTPHVACQWRCTLVSHKFAASRCYASSSTPLPFEEYKKLKNRLKWTSRLAGIPGFAVFSGISAAINVHYFPDIMNLEAAEVQPVLGMDPMVFASVCGMGAGAVGFFAGSALFNAMWKIMFRSKHQRLAEKDEDFLKRITKHRYLDFSRYEDDYYGDKILTPSDYRQWVRQQQKRKEAQAKFSTPTKESSQAHSRPSA